jgi:hypothetical protein
MTDWRAVAAGFAVLVVVGTAGASVPAVGAIGAGLVGGFAAGYLAGDGAGNGAWHGLVAGTLAGLVVAGVVGFLGPAVGATGGSLGALVESHGAVVAVSAITLLFAADSALAGAVGGWLGRRTAGGRSTPARS